MSENIWTSRIAETEDPLEMLKFIVDDEFLLYDPFYADIRKAMIAKAKIIIKNAEKSKFLASSID